MSRWRGRPGRGRPRTSVFRPKDRADMRRLAAIPRTLRFELTSAFRGAIHGLWSPGSPTDDCGARRLPLAVPPGVPFEISPKRPPCPPYGALCGLGSCRHLYVTPKSVGGLGGARSSSLALCVSHARRPRHLLRAGCSAYESNHRALAPRPKDGVLVGRQPNAHRQSRRARLCPLRAGLGCEAPRGPTSTASSPPCWRWRPSPTATALASGVPRRGRHRADEAGGDIPAGLDGGPGDQRTGAGGLLDPCSARGLSGEGHRA